MIYTHINQQLFRQNTGRRTIWIGMEEKIKASLTFIYTYICVYSQEVHMDTSVRNSMVVIIQL
jgi:hypothetical protein